MIWQGPGNPFKMTESPINHNSPIEGQFQGHRNSYNKLLMIKISNIVFVLIVLNCLPDIGLLWS